MPSVTQCPQCGARLNAGGRDTYLTCAYCGSRVHVGPVQTTPPPGATQSRPEPVGITQLASAIRLKEREIEQLQEQKSSLETEAYLKRTVPQPHQSGPRSGCMLYGAAAALVMAFIAFLAGVGNEEPATVCISAVVALLVVLAIVRVVQRSAKRRREYMASIQRMEAEADDLGQQIEATQATVQSLKAKGRPYHKPTGRVAATPTPPAIRARSVCRRRPAAP